MAEIRQTERAARILHIAMEYCQKDRHEFVTPEHLLMAMLRDDTFVRVLNIFYRPDTLADRLFRQMLEVETIPEGQDYEPEASAQLGQVIEIACQQVVNSSATALDIPHLVMGIFQLKESWACYLLKDALANKESNFMSQLISTYDFEDHLEEDTGTQKQDEAWRQLVTCMNDLYEKHNPLIGREQELQRTIQVLCRRDKNNPLHIGEPGVGKTALVWGLARMIEEGRVPERLIGCKIYQLDMGTLLAGTQYRGDFENRIKMIMDGVQGESDNNIVYIDEIHTLVGAGATGEGAMDASNMLKPYLESGNIRFIGSTTYEEYNRHFARSKGMIRRFQQIDIAEPSIDEAKHILRQLQPRYEEFHQVKYEDEAIDFAVEASAKHVNDRFLPDKAIDLIDEAGASFELKGKSEKLRVTKADIADVLAKTCKVDALAIAEDSDISKLYTLNAKLSEQIYGQDEAIRQVVEAVQMSRAGLLDDNKPLAGAVFTLYKDSVDAANKISDETTGFDGRAVWEELEVGTYVVKETKAPNGYAIIDDEFTFTIDSTDAKLYYEFVENTSNSAVKLNITKLNSATDEAMPAVGFTLYTSDGTKVETKVTNTDGEVTFTGLKYNTSYEVLESTTPTGFTVVEGSLKFEVDDEGNITYTQTPSVVTEADEEGIAVSIQFEANEDEPEGGAAYDQLS